MNLLTQYEFELAALAAEVSAGRMSLDGAVYRAFILGMQYQVATAAEAARLAAADTALVPADYDEETWS